MIDGKYLQLSYLQLCGVQGISTICKELRTSSAGWLHFVCATEHVEMIKTCRKFVGFQAFRVLQTLSLHAFTFNVLHSSFQRIRTVSLHFQGHPSKKNTMENVPPIWIGPPR